jgi:hypothetical protein
MGEIATFCAGVILPTLITVVLITVGASTPGEFVVVRICAAIAAVDVFGLTIWLLYQHGAGPWGWHYIVGAAILAFLAIAIPQIFQWIDFRQDAAARVPKNSGTLVSVPGRIKTIFSPGGPIPKIQVGNSGVFIVGPNQQGPIGQLLIPALRASQFKVESVDGKLKVSAQVANYGGALMAELIRNEWRVAPPPGTWDRNYSDDALEVKNPEGHIVLQVRLLEDVVQIQGVWPLGPEWKPAGAAYVAIRQNPPGSGSGAQFVFYPVNPRPTVSWPEIQPIFEYPSDQHLGEFVQ